jgi:DNA-binding MarR family transcriptional regulator
MKPGTGCSERGGADAGREAARLVRPQETFGFRLWHVLNTWQRRAGAALAPFDLTHMQFVTLAVTAWLIRQGEAPSQSRIACFGEIDRMTLSKLLRLLEDKGYITRSMHPDDPRANRVDLTEAGWRTLRAAAPCVLAAQQAYFGRLAPEGQLALATQLDALLAIEAGEQKAPPPAGGCAR